MKKRLEIGDVFEINLEKGKKYMQYIGDDMKQLNSSVIRVFKPVYQKNTVYNLSLINNVETEFCVHVVDIKSGEKEGLWQKVANEKVLNDNEGIIFKESCDHGNLEIKISKNWSVWRFGEDQSHEVDYRDEILDKANIDLIIQPDHVIEMINNNGIYPGIYPKHK